MEESSASATSAHQTLLQIRQQISDCLESNLRFLKFFSKPFIQGQKTVIIRIEEEKYHLLHVSWSHDNESHFDNIIRYSGVTIAPADPALKGAQKFRLSDGHGHKIIEGMKSSTLRWPTDKKIYGGYEKNRVKDGQGTRKLYGR